MKTIAKNPLIHYKENLISKPLHETRTWQRSAWYLGEDMQFIENAVFPHNIFKPCVVHYWVGCFTDQSVANKYAQRFNGVVREEFYSDKAWFISCNDFDNAAELAFELSEETRTNKK